MAVSAETSVLKTARILNSPLREWGMLELVPQTLPGSLSIHCMVTWKYRKGAVFTLSVTVWLMIMQRLSGGGGTWRRRYQNW